MKLAALAFFVAFLSDVSSHSIVGPDSSLAPLFQVYRLKRTAPDSYDNGPDARPTHHFAADGAPLLTVYSLKDFLLEADKQNVRVVMTKKDADVFGQAMNEEGILGITAGDTGTILMSSKPFDGSITFTSSVASYLRQRFHLIPGTNDLLKPSDSATEATLITSPKSL